MNNMKKEFVLCGAVVLQSVVSPGRGGLMQNSAPGPALFSLWPPQGLGLLTALFEPLILHL